MRVEYPALVFSASLEAHCGSAKGLDRMKVGQL